MLDRCQNPNHSYWARYGGRGVKVYDRWKIFEDFLTDMGERPDGTTLDRINNDGNYEPGNCRWATRAQQNRNKSDTKMLTYQGKTLCIAEWARELGLDITTFWGRIRRGWSTERAITTPLKVTFSHRKSVELENR